MGSEGGDVSPFAGQRDRVGTGANLGRRVHGGIPRESRGRVPSPGRHLPRRRPISEAGPNDRRWIGFFAPDLTKPKDSFLLPPLTDPDACTGLRPREAISAGPRPRPGLPRTQGGRGVFIGEPFTDVSYMMRIGLLAKYGKWNSRIDFAVIAIHNHLESEAIIDR